MALAVRDGSVWENEWEVPSGVLLGKPELRKASALSNPLPPQTVQLQSNLSSTRGFQRVTKVTKDEETEKASGREEPTTLSPAFSLAGEWTKLSNE